jgi:hypothetical protein
VVHHESLDNYLDARKESQVDGRDLQGTFEMGLQKCQSSAVRDGLHPGSGEMGSEREDKAQESKA